MKNEFYVYEHWRPDLDLCFYVGKGKGRRAYKFKRNAGYNSIIAALERLGMCAEVRLVASGLSERMAFEIEQERIQFWRSSGVILSNKTDGGDGFSGFIRPLGIRLSEESKKKLSAARLGIKFTPEHRAKLAKKKLGVARPPFKESTIMKMKAAAKAREARKREIHGNRLTRWSKARG